MEPGESTGVRVVHRGTDVDAALRDGAHEDIVLLVPGCELADGWLDDLRAAAYSDSRIATAAPLTIDRELTEPFEEAARRVREASGRLRPRVEPTGGPCTYIRRDALELVGAFGHLRSFLAHCLGMGLCHVVADDVLLVSERAAEPPATPPLARATGIARRALQGISIVVDGRVLSGPMNGTKLHVLELIAAVARAGAHEVRALVGEDLDAETRGMLDAIGEVRRTSLSEEPSRGFKADVVHRPFQIESPADLAVLASLGERLVITQQDLIGYHNPSYFPSEAGWRGYQTLTRRAMVVADRVVFFTAHARDEALAEDLVEPGRTSVVHIGVDHCVARPTDAIEPRDAGRIEGEELMLCIGTDYRHKNRVFALRILLELRKLGWSGRLVLAGSRMRFGGSSAEEAQFIEQHPAELRDAVLDLGEVSEPEKEWLLRRARLVLYPTVYEGFGLVPFEAAEHDVPCMWAKGVSLSELLPDSSAGIDPWDPAISAARALELMREEQARRDNVEAIRGAAAGLRWDAAGRQLLEIYRVTSDAPPSPASALERGEGLMRGGLSEDALRLVGPNGALPRELERPLLALATHPTFRAPVFGAIKAGYRASRRWRRSRAPGAR